MNTSLLEQTRRLSVDEQIELVEAIWDNLAAGNQLPPPSEDQLAELERRLADHEANPGEVVPWTEV
jgi:putative addiction module component (TIGR02574 family)